MTVISLDPGGTTGWCRMTVHRDALSKPDVRILPNIVSWTCGQFGGASGGALGEVAQAHEAVELIAGWPEAALVVESFTVRNMAVDLSPARVTAMVEYGVAGLVREQESWCTGMVKQSAAEAKTTATDERLQSWGLYESTTGQNHARDAVRHAITFFRKAKAKPQIRERSWPWVYKDGWGEED